MHVCVLGAGVIGATAAYCLLERGHRVTLVDAHDDAGRGASRANGAQLSYSYVAPLADASIWRKWPYYLLSPSSPLAIRPAADLAQWSWLLRFLAACRTSRAQLTTAQLLQLAFYSRYELHRIQDRECFDFQYRVSGKLVLHNDSESLDAARRQVDFQAQLGCVQRVLDIDECVDIEPALAHAAKRWSGGVYTADEEVGNCVQFCQSLLDRMKLNPAFRFISETAAPGPIDGGHLKAIQAGRETVEADTFVLALGAHSSDFARQLGLRLPVYPLKGYSITLPVAEGALAPRVSLTDLSRKVVYARIGDSLRVAGRVELVGMDARIPDNVVEDLRQGTYALFPGCRAPTEGNSSQAWCGFRPATPTGLPLVGPTPLRNLHLNTGHGSLGWTLACGSAALLADQIEGKKPIIDPTPYQLPANNRKECENETHNQ